MHKQSTIACDVWPGPLLTDYLWRQCNNQSVPLDTLYNHHWLMKPTSGPTTHYNTPCPPNEVVLPSLNEYGDFTYVFGVGAESRKTPAVVPDGFGYHVKAGTKW